MTYDNVDISSTLKQINDAEAQASMLERMLDAFDEKMDSLLEAMDEPVADIDDEGKIENVEVEQK